MKKLFAILLTFAILCPLIACAPAAGNGDQTSASDTSPDTSEPSGSSTDNGDGSEYLTLFADGNSEYKIVRPDGNSDSYETAAAVEFNKRFKEYTGKSLSVTNDWSGNAPQDKEILIGITSHEDDSIATARGDLGYGGFIVAVSGERVVLTANDSSGLDSAIGYFFSLFDSKELPLTEIKISKELYHKMDKSEISASLPVRAMWLSQYDLNNVYGNSDGQAAQKTFEENICRVLDNCVSIGINNVIVQVRPNADSMYPSEYYAPSSYVVGAYGNDFSYDPFDIIVKEAHKRGLAVHAWINPMRAMTVSQIEQIDKKYVLRQWWDNEALRAKYLPTVGTRVYLNVGYDEVRQLIIDGAAEILAKYPVDGLHMDDYFYPTTDASFDSSAYAEYGAGKSLDEWRRANLNSLVSGLYSICKADGKNVIFGISPAGNINTVYNSQYADIYTWCANTGYVDYICPQIYFGFDHATCAFDTTADKWSSIIKADGIDLWIGMTLGKAVSGTDGTEDKYAGASGKAEWINNKDVLLRSLIRATETEHCTGVAYFCYQYFWDPITGVEVSKTKAERDNFLPYLAELAKADAKKDQ